MQVLTDSDNPQTYWRVLKKRLRDEGNESVTNCNALKLPAADGKKRMTDVADLEQIFRIIQSVDPTAFVSQSKVIGVFGEGFDRIKTKAKKTKKKKEGESLPPPEQA